MSEDAKSVAQARRNLRQPMPRSRKLSLLAKNYWIRLRTFSDCCGNPGEPGC